MAAATEVFSEQPYAATLQRGIDGPVLDAKGNPLHEEMVSAPIPVAVGSKEVTYRVSRASLSDLVDKALIGRLELSLDGGITWSGKPNGEKVWPYGMFPVGFSIHGGEIKDQAGVVAEFSSVLAQLPDTKNPLRMVRAVLVVMQNCTTKAEVILA